uniref:Transposase n=1 Tax=Angiostrongylus cantonensis TaxID=6313 RepID=A0A0K0DK68_ANGCA
MGKLDTAWTKFSLENYCDRFRNSHFFIGQYHCSSVMAVDKELAGCPVQVPVTQKQLCMVCLTSVKNARLKTVRFQKWGH